MDMTTAEQRIERRIVLEMAAEQVPAIAELIEEHAAAVEVCRQAAEAFDAARLNLEADPSDPAAQATRDAVQGAIDAVRAFAGRYA